MLLYFNAPALAVLVKYEIFTDIVGLPFDQLPARVNAWNEIGPALLSVTDVNKDKVLQLAELTIGADAVVVFTPELAGLPYLIPGLVAAGGMAAATSTANGLLLIIANSLGYDPYVKTVNPDASTVSRVTVFNILLLSVALLAAQKPADILFLISAAFLFAAASFSRRVVPENFLETGRGIASSPGMVSGLGVSF